LHVIITALILMATEPQSILGWMFAGICIGLVREVSESRTVFPARAGMNRHYK
jgi:hypothetical protein